MGVGVHFGGLVPFWSSAKRGAFQREEVASDASANEDWGPGFFQANRAGTIKKNKTHSFEVNSSTLSTYWSKQKNFFFILVKICEMKSDKYFCANSKMITT